jgi:hypothetical protein
MRNPFLAFFIGIVLISLTAFGQISLQMAGSSLVIGPDGKIASCQVTIRTPTNSVAMVTGGPYSATEIGENTQTLQDGSRIVQGAPSYNIYRDSAGRIRSDRPVTPIMPNAKAVDSLPIIPEIYDPVAGDQYFLDTANRIAHRFKIPESLRPRPMNVSAMGIGLPAGENLGTRMIDGMLAEGRRIKATQLIGSMGNDQPIVINTEIWNSVDLKVQILYRVIDPRSGEHLKALININREEPDPKLFQVTADYKIVDETGTFTLTVANSRQ